MTAPLSNTRAFYRYEQLQHWPGIQTEHNNREESPFWDSKSRQYTPVENTFEKLERELRFLNAKNVVIHTYHLGGRDITALGMIRSTARRPPQPGVVLSFTCQHGSLSYPCDRFLDWEANLRAIAWHLEHTRKAALYGVGASGEAYRGFLALPAMSTSSGRQLDAVRVLLIESGATPTPEAERAVMENPAPFIRQALKTAHPDHGGSAERVLRVQDARAVLSAAG